MLRIGESMQPSLLQHICKHTKLCKELPCEFSSQHFMSWALFKQLFLCAGLFRLVVVGECLFTTVAYSNQLSRRALGIHWKMERALNSRGTFWYAFLNTCGLNIHSFHLDIAWIPVNCPVVCDSQASWQVHRPVQSNLGPWTKASACVPE